MDPSDICVFYSKYNSVNIGLFDDDSGLVSSKIIFTRNENEQFELRVDTIDNGYNVYCTNSNNESVQISLDDVKEVLRQSEIWEYENVPKSKIYMKK